MVYEKFPGAGLDRDGWCLRPTKKRAVLCTFDSALRAALRMASQVEPVGLVLIVLVVDAAGFEADDLPLAEAAVVDTGVAVFAADAAGAVCALEVGAGGNDGGIAIDADLEVVEV